jgi:hypothetical protein
MRFNLLLLALILITNEMFAQTPFKYKVFIDTLLPIHAVKNKGKQVSDTIRYLQGDSLAWTVGYKRKETNYTIHRSKIFTQPTTADDTVIIKSYKQTDSILKLIPAYGYVKQKADTLFYDFWLLSLTRPNKKIYSTISINSLWHS